MKRSKPLRRYTRLKARGKTSRHARRPRDFDYMGRVAKLPCIVAQLHPALLTFDFCHGRIEVNHVGGRYGEDTDHNTVAMCSRHHGDWTGRVGGGGYFAGWSLARRRGWGAIAVAVTRQAIADQGLAA